MYKWTVHSPISYQAILKLIKQTLFLWYGGQAAEKQHVHIAKLSSVHNHGGVIQATYCKQTVSEKLHPSFVRKNKSWQKPKPCQGTQYGQLEESAHTFALVPRHLYYGSGHFTTQVQFNTDMEHSLRKHTANMNS